MHVLAVIVIITNIWSCGTPGAHNVMPASNGNDSIILDLYNPAGFYTLIIDQKLSSCIQDVHTYKRSSRKIVNIRFTVKNQSGEAITIGVFVHKNRYSNKRIQLSSLTIPGAERAIDYQVDSLVSTIELNSFLEDSLYKKYFRRTGLHLKFTILNMEAIASANSKIIIKDVGLYCEDTR